MNLAQQLARIEQLQTDAATKIMFTGIEKMFAMIDESEHIFERHMPKKRNRASEQIEEIAEDVSSQLEEIADTQVKELERYIITYCGLDANFINDIELSAYILDEFEQEELFSYLKSLAEHIETYKQAVEKGLAPSLEERISTIQQLKQNKDVVELVAQLDSDDEESPVVSELCQLLSDNINLPTDEVFEAIVSREIMTIDRIIDNLICQTKSYISNGFFKQS